MKNKFFTAAKLSDHVTVIDGMGGERCYLIEGKDRALLIDGLTGVGSLKAFVRELTDLPVTLAVTHGHIDHIGAAWEYGEVFIHPDDIALMYTPRHCSPESRFGFVRMGAEKAGATLSDVVPPCNVKTYPIYDGDIFDLGGLQLEVIAVPGHTYGSVVFLDRADRVIYSGDACNPNTLLCLPGSTSIEEYRESLLHLSSFKDAADTFYGGHGPAVPSTIVGDALAMVDRILSRTDEKVEVEAIGGGTALLGSGRGGDYRPFCGGYANIMYSEETLFRREKPLIKGAPNLCK